MKRVKIFQSGAAEDELFSLLVARLSRAEAIVDICLSLDTRVFHMHHFVSNLTLAQLTVTNLSKQILTQRIHNERPVSNPTFGTWAGVNKTSCTMFCSQWFPNPKPASRSGTLLRRHMLISSINSEDRSSDSES